MGTPLLLALWAQAIHSTGSYIETVKVKTLVTPWESVGTAWWAGSQEPSPATTEGQPDTCQRWTAALVTMPLFHLADSKVQLETRGQGCV